MYLCIGGWLATCLMVTRLPPPSAIRKELYNQPIQNSTQAQSLHFLYKGQNISVVPQADYTLWGTVISHNDPTAWYRFDITHDKRSLDTRDLCVMWGSNLEHDDYLRIKAYNNDYSCELRYGPDVHHFSESELSNNHLISDNDVIRNIIRNVQIGDQIVIRGMLVKYSEERWNGHYRGTSMTRTDTGMGACETIFVQDIYVLDSYNQLWAKLKIFFFWSALGIMAMRVLAFFFAP